MKRNGDQLEDELRRQAAAIRVEMPRGLAERVAGAIGADRGASLGSRRSRLTGHWGWWAAAGAAAAAFAAALLLHEPANRIDTHADAAALAHEVQAMPAEIAGLVAPRAAQALRQDPLAQETTALAADARSAVNFLAYNFLPEPRATQDKSGA